MDIETNGYDIGFRHAANGAARARVIPPKCAWFTDYMRGYHEGAKARRRTLRRETDVATALVLTSLFGAFVLYLIIHHP